MRRVEEKLDTKQVLSVVERYSQALDLLDAYDHQNMTRPKGSKAIYVLTYEECRKIIDDMKYIDKSSLFGNEKDDSDENKPETLQKHILNLTNGEGEVFEALRRKQLIAYQTERQIDTTLETTELPEGFVNVLKEELAEMQYYDWAWNMEKISVYEDEKHRLTLEQVRSYLGEAFPDYYDVQSSRSIRKCLKKFRFSFGLKSLSRKCIPFICTGSTSVQIICWKSA